MKIIKEIFVYVAATLLSMVYAAFIASIAIMISIMIVMYIIVPFVEAIK